MQVRSRRAAAVLAAGAIGLGSAACTPSSSSVGGPPPTSASSGSNPGPVTTGTSDPAATSTQTSTPTSTPTGTPTGTPEVSGTPDAGGLEPLRGPLFGADLLVTSGDTLDADLVSRVRRLTGVVAAESMSVGQVSVQDRVLTLAAVDPSSYRRFTEPATARLQEAWVRVARGEVALTVQAGKRLTGGDGYVRLGNDATAPSVHVGALVSQVPRIDGVVNRGWGERLGIPTDNAVLLYTGLASPQSVKQRLNRLLGDRAGVQILGPDLDVRAPQTAILTGGSVAEAVGSFTYFVLEGGKIAPSPAWVRANIRTEWVPILGRVTCHQVIFPQLRAALREVKQRGLASEIHPDEYAGCYYPRFIANTRQLSLHAFGIALDLNVPGNQRGTVGEMNRDVVAIFERWGFSWGGDWRWTDPMHFEMNAIVSPR